MRVIFMGTPEFAVPSLRSLAENHEVVAVYSRPDAVSGRGASTRPSAVSLAADELGIPTFHPSTLRDPKVLSAILGAEADVIVVAAYGMILPADVLTATPLGAVNVHASLLPRWRGAAPIQRAILAGDETAGVSIMRMEEGLDTGPYCLQASVVVGDATSDELTATLAQLGAVALLEALQLIADGHASWIVQEESQVTYAEKIRKPDVAADPALTAADLVRRVRASSAAAPARACIADRGVTLMRVSVVDVGVAGTAAALPTQSPVAVTREAVLLGVSDGAVAVTRVKPDGKAEMDATAWARGVRDINASIWKASS